MGGLFSAGGLITGLDSNAIISQLLQLERQPVVRFQQRISALEKQQTALRDFRTQLLGFRNLAQDFRLESIFDQFKATASNENVLGASISGDNPTVGAFTVNVLQLASATIARGSDRLGASINPGAALNSSGISTPIEGTTFSINGKQLTFDPNVNSLNDILFGINSSGAGVTATYDALTDRVTIENSTPGDTSIINFGGATDTSNLLSAIGVRNATQVTGTSGSTQVTSSVNLGAIDSGTTLNAVNFNAGAVAGGNFYINGVAITVNTATDSVSDVLARINSSDAGVTASLDSSNDTIRVVSKTLGSRTVDFVSGTSNFLDVAHLTTAQQIAGSDSQFTINGGALQTRNTNEVSGVIGGVTLNFLSAGTSSVTVDTDNDAAIAEIKGFVDAFNEAVTKIRDLTKKDGTFESDVTIRNVESFLRQTIFTQISGETGLFRSLADIGITTGSAFDPKVASRLEFDEDDFRAALSEDRANVERLFANTGETGIVDQFFDYLDNATSADGVLNFRSKANGSIDEQIDAFNAQIDRLEERLGQREARLRQQFARLEQLSATFQTQSGFLSGLSNSLSSISR